jgi:hypothetical protein
MESSSAPTPRACQGLTEKDSRRLEIAAQAVIESARLSDNSTGINWRRLPTASINEHYLTEHPGLTNQEIALRETLEEVERKVVEHELDLDRIDTTGLQGTIEDVLNDILDFMFHDVLASSSSDTDSSGSDDSDDESKSDYPPTSRSTSSNSGSDAIYGRQAHQHQRPHHEAGHANDPNSSRASSSRMQGPHLLSDAVHQEHVQSSNTEPQADQNAIHDEGGTQANCCSTM